MTRGDEIVPAVTHATNDGPAVALGAGDATLADYEARGGLALLREPPSLERIVDELKASGLTGYGGAGFPTGPQVGGRGARARSALRRRERRRGRARDDQGPVRHGAASAPHARGDGARDARRSRRREGYIYLREEYATARASASSRRSTSSARPGCSTG